MLRHFACIGPALLLCACSSAADDPLRESSAGDQSFRQWQLPGRLREISGLALTSDQRLLAVTDEEAVVYELDYETGAIIKAFALGNPAVRGDFEGIAVIEQRVWLMTSDGQLFVTSEGGDGERMQYDSFETGLGDYCELEGLAQDVGKNALILACKKPRSKDGAMKLFTVALAGNKPLQEAVIELPEADIARKIDKRHVRPSGIAIDPSSGSYVLVAANHGALFIVSPDGALIDAIILPGRNRHRQAEGIEITADGRLLIADEGGNGRARLAVYNWTGTGLEPEEQE